MNSWGQQNVCNGFLCNDVLRIVRYTFVISSCWTECKKVVWKYCAINELQPRNTSSLIDWAHLQNNPCMCIYFLSHTVDDYIHIQLFIHCCRCCYDYCYVNYPNNISLLFQKISSSFAARSHQNIADWLLVKWITTDITCNRCPQARCDALFCTSIECGAIITRSICSQIIQIDSPWFSLGVRHGASFVSFT